MTKDESLAAFVALSDRVSGENIVEKRSKGTRL
jgi:hypothetical protein